MLHYMLSRRLVRETHARTALQRFASLGAAIHRIDNSKNFQLLVPIRRPHRRNALYKQLTRQAFGDAFILIDVTSFTNGPQYKQVTEAEADELVKSELFLKNVATEPAESPDELDFE